MTSQQLKLINNILSGKKVDRKINKNDNTNLLTKENLEAQKDFNSYDFFNLFKKVGTFVVKNEKFSFLDNKIDLPKKGCVYAFCCENKLVKIGETTTSLLERLQSYETGKQEYRNNGTCSTTNYCVLQNFKNYNKPVDLYVFEDNFFTNYIFYGNNIVIKTPYKEIEKILNTITGKLLLTTQK